MDVQKLSFKFNELTSYENFIHPLIFEESLANFKFMLFLISELKFGTLALL